MKLKAGQYCTKCYKAGMTYLGWACCAGANPSTGPKTLLAGKQSHWRSMGAFELR